jgi:chromosomal replication initiation ATPase DnaA
VSQATHTPAAELWTETLLSLWWGSITVRRRPSANDILVATCLKHGLTPEQLRTPSTARRFSWPRQEAMHLLRQIGRSYHDIARRLGLKDHTTVIQGVRSYRAREGIT